MRALVTGGAGFIGSNLVDALTAQDHTVAVRDNLTTGSRVSVDPDARLHEVDVRDADAVDRALAEAPPDVVFHLAAQIDVRRSISRLDRRRSVWRGERGTDRRVGAALAVAQHDPGRRNRADARVGSNALVCGHG